MYATVQKTVMYLTRWSDGTVMLTAIRPERAGEVVGYDPHRGLVRDSGRRPLAAGDWVGRTPLYSGGNQTYLFPGDPRPRLRSWPLDPDKSEIVGYDGGRQCLSMTEVPAMVGWSGIDDTGTHREVVGTRPQRADLSIPAGWVYMTARGNFNNHAAWYVPSTLQVEVVERDNDGGAVVRIVG